MVVVGWVVVVGFAGQQPPTTALAPFTPVPPPPHLPRAQSVKYLQSERPFFLPPIMERERISRPHIHVRGGRGV